MAAQQEAGYGHFLAYVDSLRTQGPDRGISLEAKKLLGIPEIVYGHKRSAAANVARALVALRSDKKKPWAAELARVDLVEGLAAMDSSETQLVVARALTDPSTLVSRTALRELGKSRYIFSKTFEVLLGDRVSHHDDPKIRDLWQEIVEKNPRGGVTRENEIVASVANRLHHDVGYDLYDKSSVESAVRAAKLVSVLVDRTDGNVDDLLVENAKIPLKFDLETRVYLMSYEGTFEGIVNSAIAENLVAARGASDVAQLAIRLPVNLAENARSNASYHTY